MVTGSHLDSVPDGGAFDGPLGVVSAFLAIDELRDRGLVPAKPIAVVNFADEEGARFGVACVGSPDDRRARRRPRPGAHRRRRHDAGRGDDGGRPGPGAIGRDDEALARIGVFVELHVEQGRGLVDVDAPVGVATAIWPHGRWRFTFCGEANHAGTTRLVDRRDPMLTFAMTVLAAREIAAELTARSRRSARVASSPTAPTPSPRLCTAGSTRGRRTRPPCDELVAGDHRRVGPATGCRTGSRST